MHARVVTFQLHPGKTEEAVRIYRDSIVPAAKQQPGFKGARLLTDSNTGKGISISLWETEADLKAGETSGYYQEQIAKLGQVLAFSPTRESYEVSIQETQQGGAGTYARVLTTTVQSGKMDEGMQIVRDSAQPVARQQPGFKGGLSLLDRSTGKSISITFWATEADLLAGETSGYYQAQIAKVAHVLATPVLREAYEVALQV